MSNSRFTVMSILSLAMVAFAMQFAIDFSTDNIAASTCVLASALVVLLYIYWTPAIQTHPMSTFAILGFCITTQLGALLVQSATWTPLIQNLRQPLETFITLAVFQSIALIAHVAYRLFTRNTSSTKAGLLRSGLQNLGLYSTPSVGTVWIIGLIGFGSLLLGGANGGVITKVLHGMSFVAWAPFLIPMYVLQQGRGYCNLNKNLLFLAIYAALIVLLGLATNARGIMLAGFMTIALFAMLSAMRSSLPVRAVQVAKIGLLTLVLGAVAVPVSDLITAMGIARKVRDNASPLKMVEETLYYFQQPTLLELDRQKRNYVSIQSSYDEVYFASSLAGRLIETKFHDNALYFANRISSKDYDDLVNVTGDFLWATLPDPALKALQIDTEKDNLNYSMGDYISHLGGGGGLGSRKTGSGLAQGLTIFGFVFFLVYLLVCPILFWSHDILAYRNSTGEIWISTLGMLGIWKLFQYGISAESIHHVFMAVVRGVPQSIILYLLIFYIARKISYVLARTFGRSQPHLVLQSNL